MCVCTIENMERKSRNRPEPLSQSQKHRRQAGDIILKEVMTWVSRGEKGILTMVRGELAIQVRCQKVKVTHKLQK